jgi:hypothetical protein
VEDVESTSYEFSNLPLTAGIARKLIIELFGDNRVVRRDNIIDAVLKKHLKRGGLKPTQSPPQVLKRALATLKEAGLATNPGLGFWKIQSDEPLNEIETSIDASEFDADQVIEEPSYASWSAERTIGSGAQAVYLYFLPTYRDVAIQKHQSHWQCKIGMTTTDPLERILSQTATAAPERPIIGLVIRTDKANALEKAIHAILHLRNRRLDEVRGTEWFMTNPDEVEALYLQIIGG